MTRGLRDYLRQKRESLLAAKVARPRGQDWREQVEAVVVADDATGVRKLRIRDWRFVGDSGPAFGGWGLGPSSPELLCGVLATCLTHTYEIGAALLDIPVDRIEVRVTANNNDAAFLHIATDDPPVPWGITAHVSLDAPGADAGQVVTLHAYASERCPMTKLLRAGTSLEIVVG